MKKLLLSTSLLCLVHFVSASEPLKMTVCFERWWPYSFTDTAGQPQGIEIELLQASSKIHNVTFEYSELPYQRCLDSVKNGSIDFALHIDKKDNLLMLKEPYTFWSLSLAVKKGRFSSIADLNGLSPSVMMASEYIYPDEIYQKLKLMNAVILERSFYEQTDDDAEAFFSVLNNERIDAIVVDRRWAGKMIKNKNIPVEILPETLHEEPQFIGYIEHNKDKATKLSEMLNSLPSSIKSQIELKFQSE